MSEALYLARKPSYYAPYLDAFKRKGAEGRLLDMGTGHGQVLQLAAERGISASGVEYNKKRVKICMEKGLHVIAHDLIDPLPFPDGSFGMVYCGQVIEHVDPPRQNMICKEAFRVLRPGGIFQVRSPNWHLKAARKPGHEHLLTINELKKLLVRQGFRNIDLSINHPQAVPLVPRCIIAFIWRIHLIDRLSATANAICEK